MDIRNLIFVALAATFIVFGLLWNQFAQETKSEYDIDGTGIVAVTPTDLIMETKGNTLTFTYTSTGKIRDGAIRITIPLGWDAPQGTPGQPGYTTAKVVADIAEPIFSGQSVTVPIPSLDSGGTVTVIYGNGGHESGITAPNKTETFTFAVQSKITSSSTLTDLRPPQTSTLSRLLSAYLGKEATGVSLPKVSVIVPPNPSAEEAGVAVNLAQDLLDKVFMPSPLPKDPKDPFNSPIKVMEADRAAALARQKEVENELGRIKISSISYNETLPLAVINGEIAKEGDPIKESPFMVNRILPDRIEVQNGNGRYSIDINSEKVRKL